MKVFITRKIPSVAQGLLQSEGFSISVNNLNRALTRKELIKAAAPVDAVISLLTDKFDKVVIDQLKRCKIIANYAVGYNNIDVGYAIKKGIIITNTPRVLTESTADLTMTLVLACARRVIDGHSMILNKKFKGWQPELLLGMELNNKIFGIIGAGRIGSAVARRARAFGCKVIYFSDISNKVLETETGADRVSLNYLLKNADIVSVHIPLNRKTNHLLDKEKLNLMKPSSLFINTSRGEIVDENALINILRKKKIFAAGLDVYENEPKINPELLSLKNVVLLPHIGSATLEARTAMAELAAKNVISVLKYNKPIAPVD